MIDCGLDWLTLVHRVRPHAIVITHAHPDHTFGLAHGAPCPVWATPACWEAIDHYPIDERRIIRARRAVTIEGIRFEAFDIEHSIRAPAVGYRFGVPRSLALSCESAASGCSVMRPSRRNSHGARRKA
jgi:phosphoribosyl 1,2-cyclic phosphodiesterase